MRKQREQSCGRLPRCGYGTRLPFPVVSKWAKGNYVGHGVTDQTSMIRWVEDNWQTGRIGDFSIDALAAISFDVRLRYGAARIPVDP